ncbi:MAG: histidine phosphatase family protein [Nocardioidaceae bacterium]|jgi:phosphohistidine phosphatase
MTNDFRLDPDAPHHMVALIRHAKSDWSSATEDRERPLSKRGRRQATESGQWLRENFTALDLAIVSPAVRAQDTWDLINAELRWPVEEESLDSAYTFDGHDLLEIIQDLDDAVSHVAIVGHNPAIEDLITILTDDQARMPTSAVAIISIRGEWESAGSGNGRLLSAGRPADLVD